MKRRQSRRRSRRRRSTSRRRSKSRRVGRRRAAAVVPAAVLLALIGMAANRSLSEKLTDKEKKDIVVESWRSLKKAEEDAILAAIAPITPSILRETVVAKVMSTESPQISLISKSTSPRKKGAKKNKEPVSDLFTSPQCTGGQCPIAGSKPNPNLSKEKKTILTEIVDGLIAGAVNNAPPSFINKARVDKILKTCASGVFHNGQGNMCFYFSVHKAMPRELRKNFNPSLIKKTICDSYTHSQPQTQNPCEYGAMADANIIQNAARRFKLNIIALKSISNRRYELNFFSHGPQDNRSRRLAMMGIKRSIKRGNMDYLRNNNNLVLVREENAHFEPFMV